MSLSLSPRLLACAGFVAPGARVADVGCDHGYLGIYLLQNGIASSVIASDVREGPLHSAVINGEKYGLRDKMSFYLSDGVQKIPRDFDSLICAGMGGDTMVSILEAAPWLRNSRYSLILQCQSKRHLLRLYLSDQGWYISRETVLRDGRFLYTVMEVTWAPELPRLTPGQCYFSPALLTSSTPETTEHFHWVIGELSKIVLHRGGEKAYEAGALQELLTLQQDPNYSFLTEESHDNRI